MQYQPLSKVLFLTVCSLNKREGGVKTYEAQSSILSSLERRCGATLLDRRERVRQLVAGMRELTWQGVPLADLPYNQALKRGPDFGGDHTGLYLPALLRYDGRFFGALGDAGREAMLGCGHHTLLLSGLYGLVSPSEPIQLYSCPLKAVVSDVWTEGDFLTHVLCDYLTHHGIERIFDLTAMDAYRNLVDWSQVVEIGTSVLHVFHEMSAGDYALTPLGRLLGASLLKMSEESLLSIRPEDKLDSYYTFRDASASLPGEPSEAADILERAKEALGETYSPGDAREVLNGGLPETPREEEWTGWAFSLTSGFRGDRERQAALKDRIEAAIHEICQEPCVLKGDTIKPLHGRLKGLWRYRIGDYRLVYDPVAEIHTVRLLAIAPRSSVYEFE